MISVAIIGASGYSGEELVRLVLRHPHARLIAVTSRQHAGKKLAEVFPKFASHPKAQEIRLISPETSQVMSLMKGGTRKIVVFLALPHGVSSEWAVPLTQHGIRVIDLSADFRLKDSAIYEDYYEQPHPAPALLKQAVYGLPEIRREEIQKAKLVASPGCYPTSILLPLIPLLREKVISMEGIVISSLSGVSGAGRKAEEPYLFCECNESVRAYGVPKHRHLPEIEQELTLAAGKKIFVQFTPHLIPVNRGILTTIATQPRLGLKDLSQRVSDCFTRTYGQEPFVRLLDATLPDIKNVVGTNFIEIAHRVDPRTGRLMLFSAEDNLTKGAAGQAIQSMNLMFGFPETEGLMG